MSLPSSAGSALAAQVKEISAQDPHLCLQCGTCSGNCTGREFMDFLPRLVIRLIQLGDARALECRSIWVCSTCLLCTVRCPRGIDVARLMEALRVINLRRGREALAASEVPAELLERVPQMGLVGGLRKLSA